ncbi:MAG: response regulator [Candidatus Omnitrophota bacterium]
MDKKKIFIVEDDKAALESLKKLLLMSGFAVDGSLESKEAVGKIQSFAPNLILLDLLMPNLGGMEIAQMLYENPETRGIPIIITSALGGYNDIKKAYKTGVVGYFTKPYDYEKLLREINKFIEYKKNDKTDS